MKGPRRVLTLACLLAVAITPARAADPSRGTVTPARSVSWTGESYVLARNDTGQCDEPLYPCDVFTLIVGVSPGYWRTRAGGVRLVIDGFGSNDFDVFVYPAGGDPYEFRLYSDLPAGYPEEILIPEASGRYEVVVIPYSVVNSGYRGAASFATRPKKPPVISRPPGVPASPLGRGGSYSSPSAAVDSRNPRRVVVAADVDFEGQIALFRSSDGGASWRASETLPGYRQPSPFSEDYDYIYSPSIVAGAPGEFFALVSVLSEDGSRVNIHRSTDAGATWGDPVEVIHLPSQTVEHYNFDVGLIAWASVEPSWLYSARLAGTGSTMLACWVQPVMAGAPYAGVFSFLGPGASTGIAPRTTAVTLMTARSTDGGQTWSAPVPVLNVGSRDAMQPPATACKPAVGRDGTLHVVWVEQGGTVRSATARPGSLLFDPPVLITQATLPEHSDGLGNVYGIVDAAVTPNGAVMAVYGDARGGDLDVMLSRSSDGGATWGDPIRVNDDRRKPRDQYMPAISTSPSGAISVLFYDRRNDPSNYYFDAYLARSSNGTRFTNTRLTRKMFEAAEQSPWGEYARWGTHQAVVATSMGTLAVWVDRTYEPPARQPRPGPPLPPPLRRTRSLPWSLWAARLSTGR